VSAEKPFEKVFAERLRKIEADAKDLGINMTVVCHEAGIGRATPDRWKRDIPKTVKTIDQMEAVIEKRRTELKRKLDAASPK
jgi:hypothetical protein